MFPRSFSWRFRGDGMRFEKCPQVESGEFDRIRIERHWRPIEPAYEPSFYARPVGLVVVLGLSSLEPLAVDGIRHRTRLRLLIQLVQHRLAERRVEEFAGGQGR